ncbi:MAG: carboxypeptidase regulatory-like domain-containing protein [Acidobacteria bacterium]|nr:carboxypeptidase regulatory-like domain-containing protein [Acidobacteriota bacterium]
MRFLRTWVLPMLAMGLLFGNVALWGQVDQGAITGAIHDTTGAVIPNAVVTLTNVDNGLVLKTKSDGDGVYTFAPIKIGHYTISATAPGFQTTKQENVTLQVQERLNVVLVLKPGEVTQTVTVTTAPPLMQTQSGSVGQVMTAKTINHVPLNGRNWVYIAQLANGAVPSNGSRGGGKGDFEANGQRAEQNDFILDGVDNNVNVVDFVNGASYVVQPPPDALSEFKIQTGDYSAQFGHSAGAVINATIKSGTNQIHGDAWEYFRNTVLDSRDWDAQTVPPYHQNQFGGTLGFPIIKNKLFLFGDSQGDRIVFGNTQTLSVPTAKMRQGNFSELLNTALTGDAQPIMLYEPNQQNGALLACGGQQNVFCQNQIDAEAQKLLNLYPMPNANNGKIYNNYVVSTPYTDNTTQYDIRMDYNVSSKDQMFARFSYYDEPGYRPPPLGLPLDGGSFGNSGTIVNLGENFVYSETHAFSPNLSNEFRFGYNYLHDGYLQPNYNTDIAKQIGMGGIPYGPDFPQNGGLPSVGISGISGFGSTTFLVTNEHENVFQILDNVTKIAGNHSLKFGVDFQSIRFSTLQPPFPRGTYSFNGLYTSNQGASYTGFGVADFMADQNNFAQISNEFKNGDARWYRAAYAEDDWRVNNRLTLNLGVRYDNYKPYKDVGGYQATYYVTGKTGPGFGQAVYQIPVQQKNFPLAPAFTSLLAKDNITLQYVNNPALVESQNLNFAPRIGFAYSADSHTVIRGGFGIFYGGLESTGYYPNLGENYPFQFTDTFNAPDCKPNNCPSISDPTYGGISLENGFSIPLAAGLQNYISTPALRGSDHLAKTPYAEDYNLSVERAITNNMAATIAYVGDVDRHLQVFPDPNNPDALTAPSLSAQKYRPFPDFGGTAYTCYCGMSDYNSLQAKLQKRFSHGLNFLATYTWSHALDDAPTPLGSNGDGGYRNSNLVPIREDYSNSPFDVRQRFTFNAYYQLPFGKGRQFMNQGGILNEVAGGWAANLTFFAQTGNPFTVYPDTAGPSGGGTRAILIGDPFKPGGTPPPSNPGVTCASSTRNKTNWYNPCAFANPAPVSEISPGPYNGSSTTPMPGYKYPVEITDPAQVLQLLGGRRNQIYGPGYERINMSVFKNFPTWRSQYLQFRADIFNLFNTPSYGIPSVSNDSSSGGQITGPRFFQNFTPDARFVQFALKYEF